MGIQGECLPSIAATVSRVFLVRERSSSYSEISSFGISNDTFLAVESSSSRVEAMVFDMIDSPG